MMLALAFLAAAATPTVLITPIEALGFDDDDAPRVKAAVIASVRATGNDALDGPTIDDECAALPDCVAQKSAGRPVLRMSILRVGNEVDINETLFDKDGNVLTQHARQHTTDGFLKEPIATEVAAALRALAPPINVEPPTRPGGNGEPKDDKSTATALPHPGFLVAGVGGVVAAASLVAFAAEAATLEDPASPGSAKERARVTGWVFLSTFLVGVAAAGGGAAWALAPAGPNPTAE